MKKLFLIFSLCALAEAQVPAHTQHYPDISNGTVLYGAPVTPTICTWLGQHFDLILGNNAGLGTGCNPHSGGNTGKTFVTTYVDEIHNAASVMYLMQQTATNRGFTLENMLLHGSVDMAYTYPRAHGPGTWNLSSFDGFDDSYTGVAGYSGGVVAYNGSVWSDKTNCAYEGTCSLASSTIASTLYVGYMEPFDQINFGALQQARSGGTYTIKYCNAVSGTTGACTNWNTLPLQSDATNGLSVLAGGQIHFYPPSDWVPDKLNDGYAYDNNHAKYHIQYVVTGASTSPAFSSIYGADWTAGGSTCGAGGTSPCNFRGWNATDAHRINVGTRLEYNPTPPSGATANFKYQSRAQGSTTAMYGNPSDIQGGIRTWARFLVDYSEGLQVSFPPYDSAFLDDTTQVPPTPVTPTNALQYFDFNQTNGWQPEEVSTVAAALSYWQTDNGTTSWLGTNGTVSTPSNSLGGVPIGSYNMQEAWWGAPVSYAPYPTYQANATDAYDWALPANNPNGTKFYFQATDTYSLVQPWYGSGIGMSNWHYKDGGNRTPLMMLAIHYLGSNQNTGFMYRGGGETANSAYFQTDQVYTYTNPTTLTAPVAASVSGGTISLATSSATCSMIRLGPATGGDDVATAPSGVKIYVYGSLDETGASSVNVVSWIAPGSSAPFSNLTFGTLTPASGNHGTIAWTYWNGKGWAPLKLTSDGTANMTQPGTMTWTPPGDWSAHVLVGTANLYYVQMTISGYTGSYLNYGSLWSSGWTTFTTTSKIFNSYASGSAASCIQLQHLSAIASPLSSSVYAWTRWFPAMAVDLGTPDPNGMNKGARMVTETGNTPWLYGSAISGQPAGTCTGTLCPDVWRRDFTNAIVLFRPWKSGMIESELDMPSQPIALGGTYYQLNADGTEGPAVTSVTLRGGEAAIVMKSRPVISCNAGSQQTFRAGFPAQLDGSGSYAQDGGVLGYLWQRLSGPTAVRWSSRAVAQPVISGLVAGSYVFQLTVTEGVNQAAACTVKQGVIASGDNGVVVTNNPVVDTLLGPMMGLGANPWPWYDDRQEASANLQISAMDESYPAWWDAPGPGTVTVAPGSNAVTGAGTTFTTTFCQGPSNPHTPKGNAVIAVWYQTGVPGQTGRRMSSVTGCTDDTDLTVDDAWDVGAIPAGSGLNYAADDDSTHYATNWGWGQAALPGNYGDNIAGYYALYYRSGVDDYLNAAHKLADRVWESPMVDHGASQVPGHSGSYGYPGRSLSALGLVLRASEVQGTSSDMWTGLHKIWDASMTYLNSAGTNPDPGAGDTLDKAYYLTMVSYCALFDSNPVYQSNCQAAISSSFSSIWTPAKSADGSWPQFYYTTSSWDTNSSVSLVGGSTAVVGNGTVWEASAFPSTIWLTNAPGSMPPNNQGGDVTTYTATFVDATHLQLDRPYAGTSGAHGWALASGMIGWGAQPSVMGTLAAAFDLASKAIAGTDPANSVLASSYNQAAANWVQTYGYWPLEKGLYNAAQGVNCQAPIDDSKTACTGGNSLEPARALNAGVLRGITAAYVSSQSTGLRAFANTLYNAMFAKPGTCPSGSLMCLSDGFYLSELDDGGSMMTGDPPQGNQWFGTFFGFNDLSAWPAYEVGGPEPTNPRAYYVSFNAAAVHGAAKVRIIATEPSGQALQSDCTASPCQVVVDGQQGDPLIEVWYLSNTGAVLAKTPMPL
jgi:hypothetical protein